MSISHRGNKTTTLTLRTDKKAAFCSRQHVKGDFASKTMNLPEIDHVIILQPRPGQNRKLGTKGNQSFTDFCIAGAEEITKAFCSEIAYLQAPCGSLN